MNPKNGKTVAVFPLFFINYVGGLCMVKYYHNIQDLTSDCGIAVIKSLLQYYKRYSDNYFETIISKKDINQGLSMLDIEEILAEFGIIGSCYEVNEFDALTFNNPTILVTDNNGENHYVLVYELVNNEAILSNPLNTTLVKIYKSKLKDNFKGYAFLVENIEEYKKPKEVLQKDMLYIKDWKVRLNLFYLSTCLWIIPIEIIFSIQYLLIYQLRLIKLWQVIAVAIFEVFLMGIYLKCKIEYEEILSDYSSKNQERLSLSFLEEIDNLNTREENIYNRLIKFWNNFNASDLEIKKFLSVVELIYTCLLFCITYIFSKELMLLSLILILGYIFIFKKGVQNRKNQNKTFFNSMGELSIFVEESIHNKLDRRLFSNKKEVNTHLESILNNIKYHNNILKKSRIKILSLYDIVMYFNLLLIFVYVMFMYYYQINFKIGNIFVSFVVIYLAYSLGKPVIQKLLDLERYSILGTERFLNSVNNNNREDFHISKLILSNVSVRYEQDSIKVLNGLSKEFNYSSINLIKGNNGSGKTTLLQVIMGELSIDEGEISYFDSNNQRILYSSDELQNKISCYMSTQYLNYASIGKNISYNIYNETDKSINNIFELDLEKVIFYNGMNLSQGERQKVLLSRALNKKADIYIFDEPTSNLDEHAKSLLIKTIVELKKHAIIFIVTHDGQFDEISDTIINLSEE